MPEEVVTYAVSLPAGWEVLGIFLLVAAVGLTRSTINQRRHDRREERVELAAQEAAAEDPLFDPELVRARARALFAGVLDARERGDRERLAQLLAPGLLAKELRQLDEIAQRSLSRTTELLGITAVDYVGLARRERGGDDRVTVRIAAHVVDRLLGPGGVPASGLIPTYSDQLSADPETGAVSFSEYWTLVKRSDGEDWVVLSIEGGKEGRHVLEAPIITSGAGDVGGLTHETALELGALDKLPANARAGEYVDVDYAADARLMALDLSAVDGRYALPVLEAAVQRAVDAWARAADDARGDLLDVATPEAAAKLLHPNDPTHRTRLIIRAPKVTNGRIVALQPDARPPWMTVEFEVRGRRYVEDTHTGAMVSGFKSFPVKTTETWTLALSGPDEHPWQIVEASTYAAPFLRWLVHAQLGFPSK